MKVIILKDIPKLGKKFDIKEVPGGYGRNFLIPRGLAKFADKSAIKNLEDQKKSWDKKQEEEREKIKSQTKNIVGQQFVFKVKAGDKNEVFGSVNKKDIEDALKEKGINAKEIHLEKPIKTLGEHEIEISLGFDIKTKIKIIIEKES